VNGIARDVGWALVALRGFRHTTYR
jgi:hypothetical protein